MKNIQFQRRVLTILPSVKKQLEENKSADNVNKLATDFNISRNSLQNAFKKQCGVGIRKFKLQHRMELAKQMLEEGINIKVIAFTLNYSHSRNFSTAFKKHFGVAPTQMISSCANEDQHVLTKTG
ncbi:MULTISPECIES: helix-turn-helix domain-containing protein [Niastella]|uniref:Helix-turn-helix transcriptional regulator n=1 Tax=Niastella soli TaxID=2821487 RepID=A0ABS3YY09_9BACT|nr:AraC family transcriptional regulator [Niastella soli]MBO9202821.1 helix-turn-helix transcriptional regulator [Niastella soli]